MAGQTLCVHPSSRIARENLEVFCDTWAQNINDLSKLAKELDAAASGRVAAEKQAYMSLPRPGVSPFPRSLALSLSRSNLASIGVDQCSSFCGLSSTSLQNIPYVDQTTPKESSSMTNSQSSSGYCTNSLRSSPRNSAFVKYDKSGLPPRPSETLQTSQMGRAFHTGQKEKVFDYDQIRKTLQVDQVEKTSQVIQTSQSGKASKPDKVLPETVPLADEENSSIGSASSEEKRAFEYRIGLIMDSLEEQAQNLLKISENF